MQLYGIAGWILKEPDSMEITNLVFSWVPMDAVATTNHDDEHAGFPHVQYHPQTSPYNN